MTKPELIDELAKAAGLTKQESAMVVETVFECITGALVRGEKVDRGLAGNPSVQETSPAGGCATGVDLLVLSGHAQSVQE